MVPQPGAPALRPIAAASRGGAASLADGIDQGDDDHGAQERAAGERQLAQRVTEN